MAEISIEIYLYVTMTVVVVVREVVEAKVVVVVEIVDDFHCRLLHRESQVRRADRRPGEGKTSRRSRRNNDCPDFRLCCSDARALMTSLARLFHWTTTVQQRHWLRRSVVCCSGERREVCEAKCESSEIKKRLK